MGLYCCRRERAVCINHLATTTDGSNNNNNDDNDNVLVLLQQRNTSRSCACVRGLNEIGTRGFASRQPNLRIVCVCVCVCVCVYVTVCVRSGSIRVADCTH